MFLSWYLVLLMFKSYLIVALRNLARNKLYATINIFGLSIALAICIVAYLNYKLTRSRRQRRPLDSSRLFTVSFMADERTFTTRNTIRTTGRAKPGLRLKA